MIDDIYKRFSFSYVKVIKISESGMVETVVVPANTFEQDQLRRLDILPI